MVGVAVGILPLFFEGRTHPALNLFRFVLSECVHPGVTPKGKINR